MVRRRFAILTVLATITCSRAAESPSTSEKFRELTLRGQAIRAAISTGVSLVTFGPLVADLGTQVLMSQPKIATDCDRTYWLRHSEAFDAFKDSLTIWRQKVEHGFNSQKHGEDDPTIFVGYQVADAVAKYSIDTEDRNPWQKQSDAEVLRFLNKNGDRRYTAEDLPKLRQPYLVFNPDTAIRRIWDVAERELTDAYKVCTPSASRPS